MDKFGRNYILSIQVTDGSILTIQPPFTIEFDITRNTLTSANVAQLRIYNLSEKKRNLIRFNASNYGGPFQSIVLRAGYGSNMPVIFTGNISQAWSVREGVNFITQIESFDGGFAFANARTNTQYPKGTPQQDIIADLADTLPFVDLGAIGSYTGTLARANSYSGSTTNILAELSGGGFFIDNGKVNVLNTNEYIANSGSIVVIDASSGLLGTPILEQTIVRFDMIFEPGLNVAQSIKLESITEQNFNGYYKVTGVKHRGMISTAVCGDCITTGEFFYTKILSPVATNG